MRLSDSDILIIAGQEGLCDDHWQARWLARLPTARLVKASAARPPDYDKWAGRIVAAVIEARLPAIAVAHGSGITALLHAAGQLPEGKLAGAFLVAAEDPQCRGFTGEADKPECDGADADAKAAAALPLKPLPFPSLLVASSNSPYCSLEQAKVFASAWGAKLVEAGDSGHIDDQSGHGPWPEGLMRFGAFLKTLS